MRGVQEAVQQQLCQDLQDHELCTCNGFAAKMPSRLERVTSVRAMTKAASRSPLAQARLVSITVKGTNEWCKAQKCFAKLTAVGP